MNTYLYAVLNDSYIIKDCISFSMVESYSELGKKATLVLPYSLRVIDPIQKPNIAPGLPRFFSEFPDSFKDTTNLVKVTSANNKIYHSINKTSNSAGPLTTIRTVKVTTGQPNFKDCFELGFKLKVFWGTKSDQRTAELYIRSISIKDSTIELELEDWIYQTKLIPVKFSIVNKPTSVLDIIKSYISYDVLHNTYLKQLEFENNGALSSISINSFQANGVNLYQVLQKLRSDYGINFIEKDDGVLFVGFFTNRIQSTALIDIPQIDCAKEVVEQNITDIKSADNAILIKVTSLSPISQLKKQLKTDPNTKVNKKDFVTYYGDIVAAGTNTINYRTRVQLDKKSAEELAVRYYNENKKLKSVSNSIQIKSNKLCIFDTVRILDLKDPWINGNYAVKSLETSVSVTGGLTVSVGLGIKNGI